jgi:hypothetical protein
MYNMEVSIGSYKFRLEILLLIVIVSWVMFGHMLCSCSRVGLMEGMAMMKEGLAGTPARKAVIAKNANQNNNQVEDTTTTTTEGFVGSNNMLAGPEFAEAQSSGYIMNPSKWAMPTLTYSPGTTPSAGVQAIWDRPKQQIPLPEGQLDMLANTEFKPECCPNTYSNSSGCACMTVDQFNFLRQRGLNNVPFDQY